MKDIEDYKEEYTKTMVKALEILSGSIVDWTSWKIGTRSIFRLIGLSQVLDNRDYALLHLVKNTMVYYLLY